MNLGTATTIIGASVALGLVSGPLSPSAAPSASRDRGTSSTTATAAARCAPEPRTAAGWQRVFDGLDGSWSGGDGATTVRLPDGRLMWLFGDTFVGRVGPDGRREIPTTLVRDSVVVTSGTCVAPATPGRTTLPGRGATWLWPTYAVVVARGRPGEPARLAVFASRQARTGAGSWGFARVGTAVVDVRVPWGGTPAVTGVQDLPAGDVLWGATVAAEGGTTWIYGTRPSTEAGVLGRDLLLARAPTARAGDPRAWTFRTEHGWSSRPGDATVIRPGRLGVSTVPSMTVVGHRYVIVTKPQEFLDDRVVALTSTRPWGPFRMRTLFLAPSTSTVPQYSPTVVQTARQPGVVVVSRTTTTLEQAMQDPAATRPVFHDARLG